MIFNKLSADELIKLALESDPHATLKTISWIFNKFRLAELSKIPKIPLLPRNVANCKMILDRQALVEHMPRNGICIELGVDEGAFSQRILRFSNPTKLYLVDTWSTDRFNVEKMSKVNNKFQNQINTGQVEIVLRTSYEAAIQFSDLSVDWIYIDTDHSYETTRRELYSFAPKIKESGFIAGHDYSMGNWASGYKYGVIEAVHEFCVAEDWELAYVTLESSEGQSFAIRKLSQDGNGYLR